MIKISLLTILLLSPSAIANMSFEQWQNREHQAFVEYQTQQDRAFVDMLKKEWLDYHAVQTPTPYQKPKPTTQPTLQIEPQPQEIIKVLPDQPKEESTHRPSKKPLFGEERASFDFFGIDIEILYNKKLEQNIETISSLKIANFWNKISSCDYIPLIKQIKEYQNIYKLDDWSTYLLVKNIAKKINITQNSQTLLSWFILTKLGIDSRVGFSSNTISLLIHSQDMIYGVKFFRLHSKRYYNFESKNSSRLKIYRSQIEELHAIKFTPQTPKIPMDIVEKNIRFTYQDREYRITFPYNENLIKLYNTYPQLDYNRYTKLSSVSHRFITQRLLPMVSSMNQIEAINFLLRLTQNGFKYKTDHENFGREKVMFFEETLHYAYSDCEDRAIFFAILIRELLDLDIVFVKYPNHLATAIEINSKIEGEKIIYNNRQYYIADPTYSSANIGQAMPHLKGQKIKIIEKGKI